MKPGCATEDVGVARGKKKKTNNRLDPLRLAVGEMSTTVPEGAYQAGFLRTLGQIASLSMN